MEEIRSRLDQIAGFTQRSLWAVVDGSYCNQTVLSRLPERIVLIGRARKDTERAYRIHLSALPDHPLPALIVGSDS